MAQANGSLTLPFDTAGATLYRDGSASGVSSVRQYDVYYYNANLRTVWVYSDKATGTLTAVSPDKASPTSVTVAGISYPIDSSQAAYQLSSQGTFQEGSLVTLLLGKSGGVVDVISALEQEAVYYGVVVSSTKLSTSSSTSSSTTASVQSETKVACSDGLVRTFYHSGSSSTGQLVTVTTTQNGTKVSSMQTKRLSGSVDSGGTKFAGYSFADGVEILDTNSGGGYVRIYPSRLAGMKLSDSCVRYYTLNNSGEIDRMILQDATGDMLEYVYITKAEKSSSETGTSVSGSYTYVSGGVQKTLSSNNTAYSAGSGGAVIFYSSGAVKSVRQLDSVKLDTLGELNAKSSGKSYPVSEAVQVLLRDAASGGYYAASLSDINSSDYTLTGWYDNLSYPAGGLIRIIVAAPKQ